MVLLIASMLEAISPFGRRAVGMHRGSFANCSYPSNVVAMQMSYTPNSVVARVREFAVPELVPLLPVIASSNLTICWIGESNKTWILEALTTTNRFYRVSG